MLLDAGVGPGLLALRLPGALFREESVYSMNRQGFQSLVLEKGCVQRKATRS